MSQMTWADVVRRSIDIQTNITGVAPAVIPTKMGDSFQRTRNAMIPTAYERMARPAAPDGERIRHYIAQALQNAPSLVFDDLSSEGSDSLGTFYATPTPGVSTHTRNSFVRVAEKVVSDLIIADPARYYVDLMDGAVPPELLKNLSILSVFSDAKQVRDNGERPSVLDYFVEINNDASARIAAKLINYMKRNLKSIKVVVFGEDGETGSVHPTLVVGTAKDGSMVGFSTTVVWT